MQWDCAQQCKKKKKKDQTFDRTTTWMNLKIGVVYEKKLDKSTWCMMSFKHKILGNAH